MKRRANYRRKFPSAITNATRAVLVLFAALFFSPAADAASPGKIAPTPPPVVIGEDFQTASLSGHMQFLRDPAGQLTIETISQPGNLARFTPLAGALTLGYIKDVVWVRFAMRNEAQRQHNLFIDLRPVFLDQVEIFVPDLDAKSGGPAFRRIMLGDHVPIAERDAVSMSFVAGIEAPVGDSMVYIRIKTTSSMGLRGSLQSPSSMISSAAIQAVRFGVFEGIFLLIGIANLFYWLSLRDRVYLSYGIALLSQALLFLGNNSLLPPELLPGGGAGVDTMVSVLACLSHTLGAWFLDDLLRARRNFPIFHKIFVAVEIYGVLATIAVFFGYYHMVIGPAYAMGILIFILGLVGNVQFAIKGVPGARAAVLALLALLVGCALAQGRLLGFSAYNVWTDYALETGMIAFTLYMQIALARRARRAEVERMEAQQKALDIARNAEQDASRLVEVRTAELEIARDRAEEALKAEREIQAEQIRFIDVISHQYRTPLSVVSNTISTIALTLSPGDRPNQERIERCRRAIGRLVELIDVNLHRSRLEGAAAHPNLRDVTLATLLEDILARALDTCGDRQITLGIDPALDRASVRADPELIGLAVLNLVENAHKFSAAGLPVEIRAAPEGEGIAIRVVDHGIGIPENERERLTQKYFRASNSANTSGMGLGLHMTAAIVGRHDGSLRFEGGRSGGTCVSIVLPAASRRVDQALASSFATSMAK